MYTLQCGGGWKGDLLNKGLPVPCLSHSFIKKGLAREDCHLQKYNVQPSVQFAVCSVQEYRQGSLLSVKLPVFSVSLSVKCSVFH